MQSPISQIKQAIENSEIEQARELLRPLLSDEPTAEVYYLASLIALNDSQRKSFLQKAVELDPFYEEAWQALTDTDHVQYKETTRSNSQESTKSDKNHEQTISGDNSKTILSEEVVLEAKGEPRFLVMPIVLLLATCCLYAFGLSAMTSNQALVEFGALGDVNACLFFTAFLIFLVFINGIIKISTTKLTLTNERIVAQTGLIYRHSLDLPLTQIESIDIKQTLTGRSFNYGDIKVTSKSGKQEKFRGIAKPLIVKEKINELLLANDQGEFKE